MSAEQLLVRIDATTEQLRREMKRADDTVARSTREIDGKLSRIDQSFRRAGEGAARMRTALAGLAGVFAGAQFAQGITRSLEGLEQTARQARALNVEVERFQQIEFAFNQFGLQTNDIADAFNTLADRATDAVDGMQSFRDDFALLNIEVEDLKNKDPAELFRLFARRAGEVEDTTRRNAAVVRLLGDEIGQKLIPMLQDGEAGYDQLTQRARDLNVVLSREQVAAAADAARATRELRSVFSAQFNKAVADNSDEFEALATTLSSAEFQSGVNWFVSRMTDMAESIAGTVAAVGRLRQELASWSFAEAGETLGRGLLSRTGPGYAYEFFTGQSLGDRLFGERDGGVGGAAGTAATSSRQSSPPPVITGNPPLPNVTAGYEPGSVSYDPAADLERMAEAGAAARDVMAEMENQGNRLNETMRGFGDIATSSLEEAVLQFESLRNVAKAALEDIARVILRTQVTGPLGDYIGGLSFGGGGASSGVASNVPMFGGGRASGGPVQPGYFYEVNERGQEYFAPSVPGQIIPSGGAGGGGAMAGAIPPPEVHIHTDAESRVERTETRRGADGRQEFHTWIVREVKEGMARGELDRDMQGNFGVTRRGAR